MFVRGGNLTDDSSARGAFSMPVRMEPALTILTIMAVVFALCAKFLSGGLSVSFLVIAGMMIFALSLLIQCSKDLKANAKANKLTSETANAKKNAVAERAAAELMEKIENTNQLPLERQIYRRQLKALIRDEYCPATIRMRVLKRHDYLES